MAEVSRQTGACLVLALACLVAACSIGAPTTFTVVGASVDSTHTCPFGTDNAAYDMHGIVDVRNGTSGTVTVKSVAALITLTAVHGTWLESVGSTYDPGAVTFTPTSVPAGSSTSLKLTMRSACTNGKGPGTSTSYGEYSVALTITTSTETYRIVSGNRHRIIPA
jgi:hypothetical protein